MKRNLTHLIMSLALLVALLAPAVPLLAAGTNPFGDACSIPKAANSAVCQSSRGDPVTSKNGIFRSVTNIFALVAGVVAVVVIAVGGVRYIVSGGDAEQVAKSKRTIIYAVVGLIVIVLGQAIINFVLNRI